MSRFSELPKAYDAALVEDRIYQDWEQSGVFRPEGLPDRNQQGEAYCIMMPPPNRTGTLHLGHASMLALEDLMIRFHRMRGKKALWIPGTDHAAIATQVKVEQLLIKQGMKDPRQELGREKFLEEVVKFAAESGRTINHQVRKMGSSCDWSREAYTFDDARNRGVNEMFKRMYEDGIIERGYRIVNWDPQFQTTLSDDEVLTKAVKTKLLTFKYDKDFPIAISTTRPETKFGDTAVAVHPEDVRYQSLIGKTFEPVFCGKKLSIKIVADVAVDPAFGTGALGVTPAHSMIDADIAVTHGLPTVPVIGKDGRMLENVGSAFAGLTVQETRQKVEEALSSAGLLISVEEVEQNLPVAERGGAPVENLPMEQWFVRVNKPFALRQNTLGIWKKGEKVTLKELMLKAVESKQVNIVPDRFTNTYFHWINNLRDWCISRQIWFGHRIPVWYRGDERQVSATAPGSDWTQDPDTLDTWFSSGSWTFSTLGWPDTASVDKDGNLVKMGDLAAFHPTSVLETGYDIFFFWVARMVLMSTYALGEVPFKDVYLHGLVRDDQGRKMSKSLGNIIDPLDMIPKYGTDAVHMSLILGTTPGQDVKLSEAKIEGFRNFTNKLWNISRFILSTIEAEGGSEDHEPTLADRWILGKLELVKASVTHKLSHYQFSSAGEELRDFTWTDLADWYLEIVKVEKNKTSILELILKEVLALWHPFMPFVTEELWQKANFGGALIVNEWPVQRQVVTRFFNGEDYRERQDQMIHELASSSAKLSNQDLHPGLKKLYTEESERWNGLQDFSVLQQFVVDMRRLRAELGVEATKQIVFHVVTDEKMKSLIKQNAAWIKRLVNASELQFQAEMPHGYAVTASGTLVVGIDLAGTIDIAKERQKIEKELAQLVNYVTSTEAKLGNQEFTSKAPAQVIDQMKQKLAEAQEKQKVLQERLQQLPQV